MQWLELSNAKISWGDQDAVARIKQLGARLQISTSLGFAGLFFPKETKRRERSKTYFSSPQKSLLKRILAAIGALYVGIGMGLVMGMGWDEGGGLCLL